MFGARGIRVAWRMLAAVALVTVSLSSPRTAFCDGDDEYCGEYVLSSGVHVSVCEEGPIPEMVQLVVTDWETSRVGVLVTDGTDRFVVESALPDGADAIAITFVRGPSREITHLMMQRGVAKPVRADRTITFHEESLVFGGGDAMLAATIKLPVGAGPFPGVVLIHGSGPGGREQLESKARFFVSIGLAVLSYDKRGCGGSTGNWKQVDLDVLANDAQLAVAVLRARSEVDPWRVGVWGISQGGWIGPMVAARSPDVAFVINHSGPGTSLRRQDTYMAANVLEMQDVAPGDIDLAVAALNTLYDYGQGNASAESLDTAVAKLRGKSGLEDFESLSSRDVIPDSMYAHQAIGDPAWFFHLDPDRDALAPYRRLRCPVLIVYGRLDYTVPVEESVAVIEATLEARELPDYEVVVLERLGHGMLVMDPNAPFRPAVPLSLASEYFVLLQSWLSTRGFSTPLDK